MTNCCDEISDPTPILVASRIAQDHDPIEAGSFVESDRIEKSWADEKLVIRSLFHSDRIVSGIGPWGLKEPGPQFNIKILSYQYRKSHWGDKRILRPSYLHNGISFTGKTKSLYWNRALGIGILDPQQPPVFFIDGPVSTPERLKHFNELEFEICWVFFFINSV